ncbi:hypothetical protein PLUTE_a3640 [Pseudoalteromonas luteoviolacea DSM 6061]|nr:hypothetical protein [Pseudoalteromonas luteoviolacea DSM 6061]
MAVFYTGVTVWLKVGLKKRKNFTFLQGMPLYIYEENEVISSSTLTMTSLIAPRQQAL